MSLKDKQFTFGPFEIDSINRRLLRDRTPLVLAPKAFDTLLYLVENSGRLVTREEVIKAVWPDCLVEDANLTVNISLLRKALGDMPDGQPYIETVPRWGYRFSAEVRAIPQGGAEEPRRLKPTLRRGWVLAATVGLVLVALGAAWAEWPSPRHSSRFQERRLTSFAPEMAVTAAAISTGAKFIAYANPAGLFVQVIATAQTHALDLPEPGFEVSSISWFPDSAELLVDGASPKDNTPTLWVVPVIGAGRPIELGPYPPGFVSADGTQIVSVRRRPVAKILAMRSDGSGERVLVTAAKGETFGGAAWTRDGKHILFTRFRWDAEFRGNSGSIDSYNLATGKVTRILGGSNFAGDVVSLPDGRVVYSRSQGSNTAAHVSELLVFHTDPATGHASSSPVVITNWDMPVTGLSVSASGRWLALRDLIVQQSVFLGELKDAGRELVNVHRVTFGLGREDFPRAWTPDSKALFLDSNRNGNWEIFKHALGEASDIPFVPGNDDQFNPHVSPDGAWLLYLERPRDWHEPQPISLMRMPIAGGLPQAVLSASHFSEWGLRFECPQRVGTPCVLAQRRGRDVVFRPFDPVKGFEPDEQEIARHPYNPKKPADWTISPDGSHLAWIQRNPAEARIHILPLRNGRGASERTVFIRGWSDLRAISWAPDGKGWLVVAQLPAGWTLLYVNPQGIPQDLLKVASTYPTGLFPSPDGRRLAFSEQTFTSNVWLLKNF